MMMTTTTTTTAKRITSSPFTNRDDDVVIVASVRTPMSRAMKGPLADVPPSTLLQTVLEAVLQRAGVAGTDIQDVCVGNVLGPPNLAAAVRMAQIVAGIPAESASLQLVNRQCASGLQAVASIAMAIQAGYIQIGIGAGVESMSQHSMKTITPPHVDWSTMQTCTSAMDCLLPMGWTSDTVAKEFHQQRHILDQYAVQSHRRAAAAQEAGKFKAEIVPVIISTLSSSSSALTTTTTTGIVPIDQDDGIRPDTNMTGLSKLKPAFTPTGLSTAGNSSQMTDGAAAVLLMTRKQARERQLDIIGVWRGYVTVGVPPRIMGIGPAVAIPAVLQQTRLSLADIDVLELNEAFASQTVACLQQLGLPLNSTKVNPNGGAIALGHPLGCTGARMIASALQELHRLQKEKPQQSSCFGIVSMCMGTGMGAAAVLEVEANCAPMHMSPRSSL